jgi:predicted O-linked N-acetylglucosamine transferase (SPINDLY family)
MASPPTTATEKSHRDRGVDLLNRNHLDEAMSELRLGLRENPNDSDIHLQIGTVHLRQDRPDLAVESLQRAIQIDSNFAAAYAILSVADRRLGKIDDAIAAAEKAIALNPDLKQAHTNLATALHSARKYERAAAAFELAIRLDPDNVSTLNNYANLLAEMDHPAKAAKFYRAALIADPKRIEILSNLGNVLKSQSKIDQAIACYKQTLELQPHNASIHSNLLLTMNNLPRADNGLLAEHLEWARRHSGNFVEKNFPNDRSLDRRLRIGYVSPDFRRHSVAFFLEPILSAHDHERFEIFCYSDVAAADGVTERLRQCADHWRDIVGLPPQRVKQIISEDRIDILVDLAGHTAFNRLLVFANRASPVQINYLGYPNTSGLATMDYRITDAQADPPGMTDAQHTEKLVRLPSGFLCYRAAETAPPPRDFAAKNSSPITFGTFNNFAKVTPHMIGLWSKILLAVTDSKLLIKAKSLGEESVQKEMRGEFAKHGVDGQRIQLLPHEPSFRKHLATYHHVDIGLDTFPYHGTTTTCEAMWMGVPVITRAGRAHVSRVGVSLLHRVGLEELIAENDEQYVSIAVELARNVPRLRNISSTLRQRMQSSPLTNAENFVRELETAYRQMWKTWCAA